MTEVHITPRLEACFKAGCAGQLRKLLTTWRKEEIEALENDARLAYRGAVNMIDGAYHEVAMEPENRYCQKRAEILHGIYRKERASLREVFMEIEEEIRFCLSSFKETVQ